MAVFLEKSFSDRLDVQNESFWTILWLYLGVSPDLAEQGRAGLETRQPVESCRSSEWMVCCHIMAVDMFSGF